MPNTGPDHVFDCVVLGAGIAGVTAARDLQQAGLDVLLVEGSSRIGGRMDTRRDVVPDPQRPGEFVPIEAGAEYVHVVNRERYKAFWREIRRHGFTTASFPKTGLLPGSDGARNRVFLSRWGKPLTTDKLLEEDEEVRKAAPMLFLMELGDVFDQTPGADLSAGVFVDKQGYDPRGRLMSEYTLSAHTPGILDAPPPGHPAGDPNPNDDVSVRGILADEIQDQLMEPAELRLELPGPNGPEICGYDALPREIARDFEEAGGSLAVSPEGTTRHKVTRVERDADGRVRVTTDGGDVFTARAALVTFSVGMLDPDAGEGDAIFGDLLTDEKRRALEVVKMGPITKFTLVFKERLWAPDDTDFSVLSNPEGRARTFFQNFPDREQGPHVLTALMMSKDHRWIRALNDDDAVQGLLDELQKIFDPQGAEPRWTAEDKLTGYFRRDWERDPFARGGNSYLRFHPPDAGKMPVTEAREALKNPRETLPVFWAGEATAPAYQPRYQPLAVHGAYISGKRAAEDIRFYLTETQGDDRKFERYYRKRYGRGIIRQIVGFFQDLFS